ncbi:hypothetical protein Sjap_001079 [Stephania japonica]|uniref:Uncharacterized protein n=1 Tax=Stephania japonica TaxID=461633 RepID=A0AAP0KLJ6_9MAGN
MSTTAFSAVAKRLEGKVAVITGGAQGIGESMARLFSQHGAKLIIADVLDEVGRSVCKDIGPNSASYVHCDVTDESNVENAIHTAVAKHGKLDILVNNAGIIDFKSPNIMDTKKSDFKQVIDVNLTGGLGTLGYICSKHAVVGLTRAAAAELGRFGIRVNCVSPWAVNTSMARSVLDTEDDLLKFYSVVLDGRVLEAKDIAEAALYLASDESRYVSGHNLVVDGGFTTGTMYFM